MSEFEKYTHAQLYAMTASLDPKTVSARGAQLTKAAETIETIGNKLLDHKVKGWEGEAADAFQTWVTRAGHATLALSTYSETAGKYMTLASQTMTEIHMPKYDAGAEAKLRENLEISREYRNDPDAVKLGQEAWSKLNGDHARAVDALTKLSQSYSQASTEMGKTPPPTFPPPPDVLVPPDRIDNQDMARSGGGGAAYAGGGSSAGGSYVASGGSAGAPSGEWVPGRQPQPDNTLPSVSMPGIPDREVDLDLDTVTTLPPPTAPPMTTTPNVPLPTGPGGSPPGPFVPPLGLPPIGGVKGPGLGGPNLGPFPGTTGPNGPGGGRVGGMPPGMPARDTGIMGGRPVMSTGPSSGIPRGTVIGEGAQAGRGMGGMMGGGMGGGVGGGAHGGAGGSAAGRRLASEPGGVVGGRQPAGGRSVAGGQPFTQGGSGLVRNSPVGTGVQTPAGRRDDQRGERPDYLAEDEETWQGNRRVVPPVID